MRCRSKRHDGTLNRFVCIYCSVCAQEKFHGSLKVLRKEEDAPLVESFKQVRVIYKTGISSEVERAFVTENDFVAHFNKTPKTLGYELIPHKSPTGDSWVHINSTYGCQTLVLFSHTFLSASHPAGTFHVRRHPYTHSHNFLHQRTQLGCIESLVHDSCC